MVNNNFTFIESKLGELIKTMTAMGYSEKNIAEAILKLNQMDIPIKEMSLHLSDIKDEELKLMIQKIMQSITEVKHDRQS